MKRITALILAVVTVLFCPFSASADGAATTFGISIYDSTAGAYLEPYCQITRALPMTYLDTMTILAERGAFLVEYDEKGWPVAIGSGRYASRTESECRREACFLC